MTLLAFPSLWLCVALFGVSVQAGPGFAVEGHSAQVRVTDKDERTASEWNFRFAFEDCRWEMTIASRENNYAQLSEIFCDGAEITSLSPGGGTLGSRRFEYTAGRFAGAIPKFGGHGAFLWLALGSGCVFADNPTALRPVFEGYEAQDYSPILLRLLRGGPLSLPEEVVFFSGDAGRKTNAIYRVLEYTNHSGLLLPTHFQAVLLGARNTPIVRYDGYITNILPSQQVRATMAIPADALIQDLRLGGHEFSSQGFEYVTNKWLSKEEARSRPEFRRSSRPIYRDLPKPVILFVLVLLSLAPLVLLSKRLNRIIHNSPKNE